MAPYYERASEILGIPGYHYFASRGGVHREESVFAPALDNASGLEDRAFQWAKAPFIVSDYLKSTMKDRHPLRVVLNAHVKRLQEKADGLSVEAALLTKPDGSPFSSNARFFVLPAGDIEAPNIFIEF